MTAPGSFLEAVQVTKRYESVTALRKVTFQVRRSEVACLLGDNGAGKSTLIKLLAGVAQPDEGTIRVDGAPVSLRSPRDALRLGIATVYQDLALVPLMPVYRNFWLGHEPTRGWVPFRRLDRRYACTVAQKQLDDIGIVIEDLERPLSELSGGQRQCVAIARAAYFGAGVLILDEPTASLGLRQAALVLRYIRSARDRGLAVVFITHNVRHALAVGDTFTVLERGAVSATFAKGEMSDQDVEILMSGGRRGIALIEEAIGDAASD